MCSSLRKKKKKTFHLPYQSSSGKNFLQPLFSADVFPRRSLRVFSAPVRAPLLDALISAVINAGRRYSRTSGERLATTKLRSIAHTINSRRAGVERPETRSSAISRVIVYVIARRTQFLGCFQEATRSPPRIKE